MGIKNLKKPQNWEDGRDLEKSWKLRKMLKPVIFF